MSTASVPTEARGFIPTELATPTDLDHNDATAVCLELRQLLADVFTLYVKTKNYHWHMSGPHFRDYHLLLDEQGDQIFAMTDVIAERARKLGGTTIHSIGEISRHQRLQDDDESFVSPHDMLRQLSEDNQQLIRFLRRAHTVCDEANDVATTSLIEVWIDEAERRHWFLFQAAGNA
ncbi:MAG TPA: DNA starvation/stationary phase protection protein [Caulifigura sp.]|nr:DNA starvation/stationary phase protection protein [Caulifigura sp.]